MVPNRTPLLLTFWLNNRLMKLRLKKQIDRLTNNPKWETRILRKLDHVCLIWGNKFYLFFSWPHDRKCTCDLPATPCWPSNPLSSPWCLLPQYVRFRPLLCLGTLTLPPSSLVQELPQLEWLDLVPELVASSDLSSSDTPVTHPWNSSCSLMPFLDLPCLRPWVFSVWWWLSFCSSHSKQL